MGLNYNYLLYFPKDRIWDVLQALAEFSDLVGTCETQINFPDHVLTLPFEGSYMSKAPANYDDPEFNFALSQIFDEDDEILDYMIALGSEMGDRSPPDGEKRQWGIGFIYLTVYADISAHWAFDEPADIVLFEFGTTGTKMSMLFYYSTSIREKFISLLENTGGLYGIFDQEVDYGELFWYKGKRMSMTLLSNYPLPEQLDEFVNEQS
jgi:hypothetical protein